MEKWHWIGFSSIISALTNLVLIEFLFFTIGSLRHFRESCKKQVSESES